MDFYLYNTLNKQKEKFRKNKDKEVTLYVCGMTVYDFCHLGHGRVMIAFDILIRYLKHLGYKVRYVRNITDIDDKIIKKSLEKGENWKDLVSKMIFEMDKDFKSLNIQKPTLEPRASEYIDKMQYIISDLLKKNIAYQADDIYFDVSKFKDYGKLSGQMLNNLQDGVRKEVDKHKHDFNDFVLWKKAKLNEPFWSYEWGDGRPGWHIECSAMSLSCLGSDFDIHGGGSDLKFPHHENEIAQSEAFSNQNYAKIWMHVGALRVNKEKMSKSLNNFFILRDILRKYNGEVVRFFFLQSHYASEIDFSFEALNKSKSALKRIYNSIKDYRLNDVDLNETEFSTKFYCAMNDDLNTSIALSVLFDMVNELNKTKNKYLAKELFNLGQILGLFSLDIIDFLQDTSQVSIEKSEILNLIEKRDELKNKASLIQNKINSLNDQMKDLNDLNLNSLRKLIKIIKNKNQLEFEKICKQMFLKEDFNLYLVDFLIKNKINNFFDADFKLQHQFLLYLLESNQYENLCFLKVILENQFILQDIYTQSDYIRNYLLSENIILEDTITGVFWRTF